MSGRQEQLEQAQALTRDWNQKSRLEQIVVRHQIWGNSALPDSEYTASWHDVKLLIEQNERLREVLRELIPMQGCIDCQEGFTYCDRHGNINETLKKAATALSHAEQGEGS